MYVNIGDYVTNSIAAGQNLLAGDDYCTRVILACRLVENFWWVAFFRGRRFIGGKTILNFYL